MQKHILVIDPLEKLNIKKDSSLMLALELQKTCTNVYITFLDRLTFQNTHPPKIEAYTFAGGYLKDSFYLKEFQISNSCENICIDQNSTLHMRLDPPFDLEYLQCLWVLESYKAWGAKVINDSEGILLYNEKLYAYTHSRNPIPTFFGRNSQLLKPFFDSLVGKGHSAAILKPVDLFQGEGVTKVDLKWSTLEPTFVNMVEKYGGGIVVQAFIEEVYKGEVRSIFFNGKELGSINKVPAKGSYLANVAQGAQFEKIQLPDSTYKECEYLCQKLLKKGVQWVAFDILGGKISEINITCPGLLVEVSQACQQNLGQKIVQELFS